MLWVRPQPRQRRALTASAAAVGRQDCTLLHSISSSNGASCNDAMYALASFKRPFVVLFLFYVLRTAFTHDVRGLQSRLLVQCTTMGDKAERVADRRLQ